MKRVHFIAIGGSAMHNLAIALKSRGYQVTGSDDDIFEPSRSHLEKFNLLPPQMGWFPERITPELDYVILGMHARIDNPELVRARETGLNVLSFPEFIYHETMNKKRVVIAGSHGKSTITSLIMHILRSCHYDTDYLVGAGIEGFENMVRLTEASDTIILEGDEYFSSALDKTPKFLKYKHHIGLVSGIAWDHINAFPTRELYREQFAAFIRNTPSDGILIFNHGDPEVKDLVKKVQPACRLIPYDELVYQVAEGRFYVSDGEKQYPLRIFGQHNMQNLAGALKVVECLGVSKKQFYEAVTTFPGAKNRLETLVQSGNVTLFRDFAHAPSKVRASVHGVRELHPDRILAAVLELHTYSSLNPDFLSEYKDALKEADQRFIYLNDHALQIKKMSPISDMVIREKFNDQEIKILRSPGDLKDNLRKLGHNNLTLLLMSSGDFGGTDIKELFPINN